MQTQTTLAARYGVGFRPVALANTRAALVDASGLLDRAAALAASPDPGEALAPVPGRSAG